MPVLLSPTGKVTMVLRAPHYRRPTQPESRVHFLLRFRRGILWSDGRYAVIESTRNFESPSGTARIPCPAGPATFPLLIVRSWKLCSAWGSVWEVGTPDKGTHDKSAAWQSPKK